MTLVRWVRALGVAVVAFVLTALLWGFVGGALTVVVPVTIEQVTWTSPLAGAVGAIIAVERWG